MQAKAINQNMKQTKQTMKIKNLFILIYRWKLLPIDLNQASQEQHQLQTMLQYCHEPVLQKNLDKFPNQRI